MGFENEEKARQMYDRGEGPYGFTEKEKIENTQHMVNSHNGLFDKNISSADAKEINYIFEINKQEWDDEKREVEYRERIFEVEDQRKKRNIEDLQWKITDYYWEYASNRIKDIDNAIYQKWTGGKNIEMDFRTSRFTGKLNPDGSRSRIEIGTCIEFMQHLGNMIDADIYMISKYRENIDAYRIFNSPIDNKFLATRQKLLIESYLKNQWINIINPFGFSTMMKQGLSSADNEKYAYEYSVKEIEKLYKESVEPYFSDSYIKLNYSLDKIVTILKNKVFRLICYQKADQDFERDNEWNELKNYLEDYSARDITDKKIFALEYFVCCYKFAYKHLCNSVTPVEKIESLRHYTVDELEEILKGDYETELFNDIRRGTKSTKDDKKNIYCMILALICSLGVIYNNNNLLVGIVSCTTIYVVLTTATITSDFFKFFRGFNYLASSISSGILLGKWSSYYMDIEEVPLFVQCALYVMSGFVFYTIFYLVFGTIMESIRRIRKEDGKLLMWHVVHGFINCIVAIICIIFS